MKPGMSVFASECCTVNRQLPLGNHRPPTTKPVVSGVVPLDTSTRSAGTACPWIWGAQGGARPRQRRVAQQSALAAADRRRTCTCWKGNGGTLQAASLMTPNRNATGFCKGHKPLGLSTTFERQRRMGLSHPHDLQLYNLPCIPLKHPVLEPSQTPG